jgi:hypothetical protein
MLTMAVHTQSNKPITYIISMLLIQFEVYCMGALMR